MLFLDYIHIFFLCHEHLWSSATLTIPESPWKFEGGSIGKHSEHLGHLLAEMQYMQRAYPNMEW